MKVKKRTVLKSTVLIALLVLFYVYYFGEVIKHFTEQLTNTAKFVEKITVAEPPTITLCFDPRFKPSVFEEYNITNWIFFEDYYPKVMKNKTIKANGQFSANDTFQVNNSFSFCRYNLIFPEANLKLKFVMAK